MAQNTQARLPAELAVDPPPAVEVATAAPPAHQALNVAVYHPPTEKSLKSFDEKIKLTINLLWYKTCN